MTKMAWKSLGKPVGQKSSQHNPRYAQRMEEMRLPKKSAALMSSGVFLRKYTKEQKGR
jgi:hypothetical protein